MSETCKVGSVEGASLKYFLVTLLFCLLVKWKVISEEVPDTSALEKSKGKHKESC